jgi:hypothetical protein
MNTAEEAVDLILQAAEAVGHNIAVWHRGGTGKQVGKAQERAFVAIFKALVGRKPTPAELDAMGGTRVFGGM